MGEYDKLGTRAGFNRAVRHLQTVIAIDEDLSRKKNMADLLNDEIDQGYIEASQALSILNALLVTKHGYFYKSFNIKNQISEFEPIVEKIGKWNTLDITISYRHPFLGFTVINPKNLLHWKKIQDVMRDELVVVYCKFIGKADDEGKAQKIAEKGIRAVIDLLQGKDVSAEKEFIDESLAAAAAPRPVAPVAAVADSPGAAKVTPKYSVQVSNELFHNGNVEAWKNIMESYLNAHPDLRVTVYHEGELIQDLNTLFKWGKVKHGGLIFFQVAGNDIKNVSKLKRYLYEGASSRFEAFLKKDVNRPLNLF